MIFSFIDSFSFLLMASPPDVPPIKPLRDLSHLVNTLIQHYLFVYGGIQRKRNTGAGYSELFQARLILTAFDRSDSKALSSYGVEMRNGRTEVEGAGRCRGDSNETRSFRPTERAGREESSHIKVLSRKKKGWPQPVQQSRHAERLTVTRRISRLANSIIFIFCRIVDSHPGVLSVIPLDF